MSTFFSTPFLIKTIHLPEIFTQAVLDKNYLLLESAFHEALQPNGVIYQALQGQCDFSTVEGIIAIRKAEDDEEGIWHDDGSRKMGFSLSLNREPSSILGGDLLLRPRFKYKDSNDEGAHRFPPQPYGTLIMFKTGLEQYEHRVTKVKKGERIVLAGWCS